MDVCMCSDASSSSPIQFVEPSLSRISVKPPSPEGTSPAREAVAAPGEAPTEVGPFRPFPLCVDGSTSWWLRAINISAAAGGKYSVQLTHKAFAHSIKLVLGNAEVACGRLSPTAQVTLPERRRRPANIPVEAQSFAFAYPLDGLPLEAASAAETSAEVCFIVNGGFIYWDRSRKLCGVNALQRGRGLTFSPPVAIPRDILPQLHQRLLHQQRMHMPPAEVTDLPHLVFCWLAPGEQAAVDLEAALTDEVCVDVAARFVNKLKSGSVPHSPLDVKQHVRAMPAGSPADVVLRDGAFVFFFHSAEGTLAGCVFAAQSRHTGMTDQSPADNPSDKRLVMTRWNSTHSSSSKAKLEVLFEVRQGHLFLPILPAEGSPLTLPKDLEDAIKEDVFNGKPPPQSEQRALFESFVISVISDTDVCTTTTVHTPEKIAQGLRLAGKQGVPSRYKWIDGPAINGPATPSVILSDWAVVSELLGEDGQPELQGGVSQVQPMTPGRSSRQWLASHREVERLASARKIQRCYKAHREQFESLGKTLLDHEPTTSRSPAITCTLRMRLPQHSSGTTHDIKVCRLSKDWSAKTPSPQSVTNLLKYFHVGWGLRRPSVLISVTGSAQGMTSLSPRVKDVFSHGIVKLCLRSKAWVFTGGT